MALASQMARSASGRRYMASRRRRSKLRWLVPLLILTVVAVIWLWRDTDTAPDQNPIQNTPVPSANATSQAIPPAAARTAAPAPVPAPVEHEQPGHTTATSIRAASLFNSRAEPTPIAQPNPTAPALPAKPKTTLANRQDPTPAHTPANMTFDDAGPIALASRLINDGHLVQARITLNTALNNPSHAASPSQSQAIRNTLAQLNETLIFSSRVIPDDPLTKRHKIQAGEFLASIAPKYHTTYQLIEHINGIDARRIQVGQRIKVVQGPFHAVIHKSQFRMDVFLPSPDGEMVYIRSFPVGLGEDDSTPVGNWIARRGSKVANPGWTNPRSGKVYNPDDPRNPIGEFWIGLEGIDDNTKGLAGYGVHGTIEPDSIGKQVSMGCIRLGPEDIEMVYKLLVDGKSTIAVRP